MPMQAYVGVEGTSCPARPKTSNGELQAPNDRDGGHQQRPKPHADQNRGGARRGEGVNRDRSLTKTDESYTRTYLTEATACERGHDERGVDAGRPLPRCEDRKQERERGCRRGSTSAEVRTTGQEGALGGEECCGEFEG